MSNFSSNPQPAAPIALTCGEPAGIGPDLAVMVAQRPTLPPLVAIADPELLSSRARLLGLPLQLKPWQTGLDAGQHTAGELWVTPLPLKRPARPGQLDPLNSDYVLQSLRDAAEGALSGRFAALVTAPVQKSVINDAGHPFSGHTEFFAELAGVERVVMMLACPQLRVALVTTHLPLCAVPAAITATVLDSTLRIVDAELRRKFGINDPRLLVAGLNPHAGEGGHLGREEIEVITPVLERLRGEGMRLEGPLPADTLFTPPYLARADAVVAMYHDQGLPVLKALGFGEAVNITLGLPFIRTSVDHGTALDLAGTGRARVDSLLAAIDCARQLTGTARP